MCVSIQIELSYGHHPRRRPILRRSDIKIGQGSVPFARRSAEASAEVRMRYIPWYPTDDYQPWSNGVIVRRSPAPFKDLEYNWSVMVLVDRALSITQTSLREAVVSQGGRTSRSFGITEYNKRPQSRKRGTLALFNFVARVIENLKSRANESPGREILENRLCNWPAKKVQNEDRPGGPITKDI